MTSQKDQIQGLIADIDGVLQKTTPRLPWVMSGEVTQQRQTLERVRNYLVALQRRMAIQDNYGQPEARADLLAHDISYQSAQPTQGGMAQDVEPTVTAQQMLQTVVQEMSYLRTTLMQPLQSDLDKLRQQRESLVQEIQQLEAQRQGYAVLQPQVNQQQVINDFLQTLMGRLQETLPQQIAQALAGTANQSLPYNANPSLAGSFPAQEGQSTQPTTDRLILNLDSTLKLIFESLERNVQAYQESLTQGLDRMHGLGQQGEMMFTALINHLAQQLGREASSYLQSSKQFVELDAAAPTGQASPTRQPASTPNQNIQTPAPADLADHERGVSPPVSEDAIENFMLPYPGAEIPRSEDSEAMVPAELDLEPPSSMSVDAAIDAWLKSANAASGISLEDQDTSDLNLPGLNLTELDLNQIDLNQIETQDLEALLETDTESDTGYFAAEAEPLAETFPLSEPSPAVEASTEDIDAALKLLEQLSSELQDDSAVLSLEDADAEIDRMLNSPSATGEVGGDAAYAIDAERIPDDARDELDEFYESLFGPEAGLDQSPVVDELAIAQTPAQSETQEPLADAAPDPTLGWDLFPGDSSLSDSSLSDPSLNDLPVDDLSDNLEDSSEAIALVEREEIEGWHELTPAFAAEQTLSPPAGRDQISRLTDLFEDVTSSEGLLQESGQVAGLDSTALVEGQIPGIGDPQLDLNLGLDQGEPPETEDSYPPASPDEDLLGLDESSGQSNVGLWLDDLTLSGLSEDLSSFEEGVGQFTLLPEVERISAVVDEPSLADWGMEAAQTPGEEISLQDLVASLTGETPTLEIDAEESFLLSEPIASVPTLEGMDDLFGDLPPVPSVTPAPPPALLSIDEEAASFTLEGLGDLFADTSAEPTVNPISPPGSTPPVDALVMPDSEESESLLIDDLLSMATPSRLEVSAPIEAPATFTLEGMDDLFEDVPAGVNPGSIPAGSEIPTPPTGLNQPVPFTLEGLNDLFADTPAAESPAPAATVLPDRPDALTLEGMDDLFTDALPVGFAAAPEPTPSGIPSDQPTSFTLEQMGDVFMEVPTGGLAEPSIAPPMPTNQPTGFTLEQMGEVFVEVPLESDPPASEPPVFAPVAEIESPTAFTLEQVGDLFMEIPSSPESFMADAIVEMPEAFSLEQVGDLFLEVPLSENSPAAPSAPSDGAPKEIPPQVPEKKKKTI